MLEAAGRGRAGLNPLNALRRPDVWRKLHDTPLPQDMRGETDEVLVRLAVLAGMELDVSEMKDWRIGGTWRAYAVIRSRGGTTSLYEAIANWPARRYSVILESDRIRLVPRHEAREFWKAWWE